MIIQIDNNEKEHHNDRQRKDCSVILAPLGSCSVTQHRLGITHYLDLKLWSASYLYKLR